MITRRLLRTAAVTIVFALPLVPAAADTLPQQAVEILHTRCSQCHGAGVAMSDLRVGSRESLLKGGKGGPAIVPGDAQSSRVIQAITHVIEPAMPPTGDIPTDEIAALRKWIDSGAEWPQIDTAAVKDPKKTWWAFQKPARPEVPAIEGAKNPVDAFILDKLAEKNIPAADEAQPLALVRRAYFDLHGLPPTPQQAERFLADPSPEAWKCLIDELLGSPRYGEKWAQFWLDLVRYGDTSGFEQDPYNLDAWRYRDYVIKSFNDDKPYDRFVKEQIAGDEIYPEDAFAAAGTGYYTVGTHRDLLFKVEELNRTETLTDYVDTTSSVFLGLTVGCARCHDHKFDPIPQTDFYRMQAVFAPITKTGVFLDYNPARFFGVAENSRTFRLRQIGDEISRIQKPYRETIRKRKLATLPKEVQVALDKEPEDRTPREAGLVQEYSDRLGIEQEEIRAELSQADLERIEAVERRLLDMFAGYGAPPIAPGVTDISREAPKTFVALRGNPDTPGEEIGPGYLTCLGGGEIPEPALHAKTTGRRKALAEWIADPGNPLTARVMVNRIWQGHFGAGLLKTPSDFGIRASEASHPELLDWLATEFVRQGWSVKALHRLIMTSDTYRRSANPAAGVAERDPQNLFLSHMNRRRLRAEEIRDAVLSVSGRLNPEMGGIPVVPPLEKEELYGMIGNPDTAWPVSPNRDEYDRRSIYLLSKRTFPHPMLEVFDRQDGVLSCSRRNESTTAPQSLTLLNSRFMMEQAQAFAAEVKTVDEAFLKVFGRAPTAEEQASVTGFIESQTKNRGTREAAFAELARALLNANEFLYVD